LKDGVGRQFRPRALIVGAFTICLVAASTVSARGSTVLAVLLGDEIIMAGDSRAEVNIGRKAAARADDACKVFVVGRYVFGFTGMAGDATDHFDPRQRVVEILRRHQSSVEEAANAVADRLYDEYLFALDRLRRQNPQGYARKAANPIVASVVLGAIEGGRPKAMTIDVLVRGNKPPVPASYSARGIISSGERDAIQGDVDDLMKGPSLKSADAIAHVTALIAKQAQHTGSVGGDVDVVRLTKNGAQWHAIKQGCPREE
jgi:20S proteasome alpha/beta subunit